MDFSIRRDLIATGYERLFLRGFDIENECSVDGPVDPHKPQRGRFRVADAI